MGATWDLSDLLDRERAGWDALCDGRGGAFYGDAMTADAVMVLPNGMVLDRDAVAGSLDDAPPWSSYEISDARLVSLGEEAAALVYFARATRDGQDPFAALMTSVYRVVDGAVALALYQQTPAPDD